MSNDGQKRPNKLQAALMGAAALALNSQNGGSLDLSLAPSLKGRRASGLDVLDPLTKSVLELLASRTPFPMRHILTLYHAVKDNVQDTITIVQRAAAQGVSLDDLLAKMQAANEQAGQDIHPNEITVDVKVSQVGRIHVEFNQPIQYLVLTPEGADGLVRALIKASSDADFNRDFTPEV